MKMKAIILNQPGGVGELHLTTITEPSPATKEVLIQVKAISINPVDVKTRAGKGVYGRIKEESPLIIGWDVAGIVTKIGKEVSHFKVGDSVFGMINFPGHGKAYAAYVVAQEDQIALKPDHISFEEAAASTLAALTAWQALVKNANVKAGQHVLIHAAAGGVGHFAVQIAKHLGAIVTGTSSAKNKDFILAIGADHHINYHDYDWDNASKQFDFVLDTIGGDNIDKSLSVCKTGGTIISLPSGLNELVTEKAKAKGVNGYFILVQSNGSDMQQIASLLSQGTLKPFVGQIFPFTAMKEAHLAQETGRTVGKIVVTV
jgi:NADPH:quinone reductase-like Zn-dependent oxidoreductase